MSTPAAPLKIIDLYSWSTPNGQKIQIMLEECGLAYAVHPIDISKGEQFDPAFLAISPNNRIPAIVDPDGPDGKPLSLFESGAILVYLAGKAGRFLPTDVSGRYKVLEWLMWQMGGFGPMLGQNHHFRRFAPEKVPYGIQRYTDEARRLYGVLDRQLARQQERHGPDCHVAADGYSIADMAIYPWTRSWEAQGMDMDEFPHVRAWRERVGSRPAVVKGMELLAHLRTN